VLPRHAISDEDFERIKGLLPGKAGDPGVTARDDRLFIDAVLGIAKTSAAWRDLPERFGNGNSVWKRSLQPPGARGPLGEDLPAPAGPRPGVAHPRPHRRPRPPARRRRRKKVDGSGGQEAEALGRSRGGFSTKVHVVVSGLGLPVPFLVTPGQHADVSYSEAPLAAAAPEGTKGEGVIADKGYDSKAVVAVVESMGAGAVIPTQKSRKGQRVIDAERYKGRNLVGRFWSQARQSRRVATRYEKTARNYLAFVHVASIMILLR